MWRPDTVITDYEGTEMFVLLDQVQHMRSYEAIFGDLDGRRLVCIKRHLISAFWRDGYYFCTYQPNYKHQKPLIERDVDNKKVYPFSYLQVNPMKGRFYYRLFDNQEGLSPPKMRAENPWLGFMVVCCTPIVRTGKWTASFQRRNQDIPTIHVDQWRNCVDVGPGNDVLAALCMAYVFDRYQCQPLITVVGAEKEQYVQPDDHSIESDDENDNVNSNDIENNHNQDRQIHFDNLPSNEEGAARSNKDRQPGAYVDGHEEPKYENEDFDEEEPEPFHDFDEFVNSRENENMENRKYDDNRMVDDGSTTNTNIDLLSVDNSLYTTNDGTRTIPQSKYDDNSAVPSMNTYPRTDGKYDDTDFFSEADDASSFRTDASSSYYQQPTVLTENDTEDWLTVGRKNSTNDASTIQSSTSTYNSNPNTYHDKNEHYTGNRSNMDTLHEYDDEDSEPKIV
jgi:hypothetical protein